MKTQRNSIVNKSYLCIFSCRVCNMDYEHHMMSKKCIRTHAMTHYRKYIVKEMQTNQPHNVFTEKNKVASYYCYICGIRDVNSSYLTNHLGIYHKRLDFYNVFSTAPKTFLSHSNNKRIFEAATSTSEYLKGASSPSGAEDAFSNHIVGENKREVLR